ncbi:magnesium-dependent phosphatase-1 [uncultured Draconibacterium sp.]|uniref:magnesium-dependent phosphatase-1 n=1 Tax=uncultured Draconibacterium sp. TaxID=1573823 RepID=UPI0025D47ECA|nr:magnesium-dependent phosphatase-1 [uncultured Draconibacterium sp.]
MRLFVFDLDFTIWDAGGTWCDATNPPYFWENGALLDQSGSEMQLYPEVIGIFDELQKNDKKIAAASRTFEPGWAQDLLHLFDINKYFDLKEIYPGTKVAHFKKIQNHFKLPYTEMVFFDDEYRNIHEVSKLGVKAVLVENGLRKAQVLPYLK